MKTVEIKRLLLKFYRCYGSDMPEAEREKHLAFIRAKLQAYEKRDVSKAARILAAKRDDMPYLFKAWCDIVMLTGEA